MPRNPCNLLKGGLPAENIPPISLDLFGEYTGLSPVSLWRFQKRGWLKTYLISNRRYVLAEDVAEFNRRLKAGDFASEKMPNPSRDGKETPQTEVGKE